MGIEAYVPAQRTGERPAAVAGTVTGAEPLDVALLANGKPNSVELLDALVRHLREDGHLPVAEARSWRKSSVSVPPTPEQFDEIVGWADVALVAVGD
jgi:hypothetical protein